MPVFKGLPILLLSALLPAASPAADGDDTDSEIDRRKPTADARRGTGHWAFQPIRDPQAPHLRDGAWVRSPIDAFVLARLQSAAIKPSPEAPRATLLRRVSVDLIGLPPTPEDVREFLAEESPGAYEKLVDRLLASPEHGERWGRYWLDMARYADSDGYEKDRPRPHAWRWREWVIVALNDDKPFDEFTVEQLAGDLLPGATTAQKVATGFHRNTLINTEGGVDREEDRVKRTVDRTNTLGAVWLGLTVGCAQCHGHKYDPLSQREYYGLYAFFNSLEEADISAPLPRHLAEYQRARVTFDEDHAAHLAAIAEHEQRDSPSTRVRDVLLALELAEEKRSAEQKRQVKIFLEESDPQLIAVTRAAAEHARSAPEDPRDVVKAQAVRELAAPRATQVHIRGDFLNKGVPVVPGVPGVLPPLAPRGAQADRLDLARWLLDPRHPLTARVIANRIWQQYFGRGIVVSDSDFGTQGEQPSHPELLDWLATRLRLGGWSLKALHRLIVTSSTYRQASTARPQLASRDPLGRLLVRQKRLRVEAEVIRDLALAASGLLHRRIGGRSVYPPQPAGVAQLGFQDGVKWATSTGGDRYRRGVYTFFQRTVPYPMFMTFDAADSNTSCTRRERSNTPLQALTLWNDDVFFEAAQALGRRIVAQERSAAHGQDVIDRRLRLAVLLCLGRQPAAEEAAILRTYYRRQLAQFEADGDAAAAVTGSLPNAPSRRETNEVSDAELAAWIVVGRTLLNTDEFITRE